MDNINLIGEYHRPFWFPFASVYVPVTPCVLDGSLSFLEMVWKLLHDLNKVNEATNANHTDIMTLAAQIETLYDLYDLKLSFLEVTFSGNPATPTADKTFEEIVSAYQDKIVLGRAHFEDTGSEQLYIALGYGVDNINPGVMFYALEGSDIIQITVYASRITRRIIQLITTGGGAITGSLTLPDRDPTLRLEATPKFYVDETAAAAAAGALSDAKDYADSAAAGALSDAKDYADLNFIRTDGNAGSAYGTRSGSERDFSDIPAGPATLTIDALYNKLGRWYQEIANKITRAEIVDSGGTLRCSKPFADLYNLLIEGQEIEVTYNDSIGGTLKTNLLHVDSFNATLITFKNGTYTITLNSSDAVTVTP